MKTNKNADWQYDHGNEWRRNPGELSDAGPLVHLEDEAESREQEERSERLEQMRAPQIETDQSQLRDRDRSSDGLLVTSVEVVSDSADLVLKLQRSVSKYASVEQVQYLGTDVQVRGHEGHILTGSTRWRFQLRDHIKKAKKGITFLIPIRNGYLEDPTVFRTTGGQTFPFTTAGFDRLFGELETTDRLDAAVGLAMRD